MDLNQFCLERLNVSAQNYITKDGWKFERKEGPLVTILRKGKRRLRLEALQASTAVHVTELSVNQVEA